MTKNSKTVVIVAIIAALVLILGLVFRDFLLSHPSVVNCPDGSSHPQIDIRDFTSQYWAYSAKLEVSVADRAKVSTQIDPKTLEQVSQGLQSAREFRKFVVAGYNSCAVTPSQYERFAGHFQALDSLAQEIDSLISKQTLSSDERRRVSELITQYRDLASRLGSD